MADKTNCYRFQILLFFAFFSLNNCLVLLNNSLNECKCESNRAPNCYQWLNRSTCSLMNGKFNSDPKCNCCPTCLIMKESCYQSIPGFKVRCNEGMFCSKKYGLICIDLRQKILEESLLMTIDNHKNPYEDKLLLLVPEHKRPLKRIIRTHKRKTKQVEKDPDKSYERLGKSQRIVENV